MEVQTLTPAEESAVRRCLENCLKPLEKVSPIIASTMRTHTEFFMKAAQVAKAHFPESKPIAYPAEPGTIGVDFLIPQAVKYTTTPSPTLPAYTSYKNNLWEMDLVAGTPSWILGDGTNWYKACPETRKHVLLAIAKDGVVEVGTTPKIRQMVLKSEIQAKYSPWVVHPLVEETIEAEKKIYQYNTLGSLLVYHDLGVMWGVMPEANATSVIKLLGLFFYEYDFMPTLKWL